ncbi:MAG: DUF3237 domain-containing protein [Minwuia sp.]|nr:DUF3237 domain-containing protein [Minwuia sp.]
MQQISFEHLFDIDIAIGARHVIGRGPFGNRVIAEVTEGIVTGPRIKGEVMPGTGGDWVLIGQDGTFFLDVRLTIKTDDGAFVYMTYHGVRHGSPDVLARLDRGEAVDPSEYYFRTAPMFETGDERYAWMNRIVAVGLGDRSPRGPRYSVHQVL